MHARPSEDWTRAFPAAVGLGLSAWTRQEGRLKDPLSARLLELALEAIVLGRSLRLHAYLVLPSSLHLVVSWEAGFSRMPWPVAFGQARALHARWDNRRLGQSGSVWSERTRILPLRADELCPAIADLHRSAASPRQGRDVAERPPSSLARLKLGERLDFLSPPP